MHDKDETRLGRYRPLPRAAMTEKQKLSDARWLIGELDQHQGAEGWSVYLEQALKDFQKGKKINRKKPS